MSYELKYPEKTMYHLIKDISEKYPHAEAYEFFNLTTDFKSFVAKIDDVAAALYQMGVRKGDAVTICMPNVPQALHCFYAVNKIGAIANMIHPLSSESSISFYLNISESRVILTLDQFYDKVTKALTEVDHPVTILTARVQDELPVYLRLPYIATEGKKYLKYPDTDNGIYWKDFLKNKAKNVKEVSFEMDRTAVILYSGGTSGTPKGICLTDFNMNNVGFQCVDAFGEHVGPGTRMLSCMPMFHGFGLGININMVLIHGGKCILMPNFNIKKYAQMIIKKKPHVIAGVPTIFEALLHIPDLKGVKLDFMQGVFCGGDSLSIELKNKVDAFLKEHGAKIKIRQGYGLTECVTASCLTPYYKEKEGSIGLPFTDMKYAIVEPGTDDVLPPNKQGEIIITGPTLMKGYLKNPEETAQTLRRMPDGNIWLYTGDLGHMDEEGFVFFSQRIKRMIVTNGYNVYPGQLENVIDSIPEVAYSCVIGVKDERRGQRVRAYVVLRDGHAESDEIKNKIMEALKKNIDAYALPKEIMFKKELPKTLVGKVFYRQLEEEANLEEEKKKA